MRSPRFPLASAPSPHVLLALDLHEKHPYIAFDRRWAVLYGLCRPPSRLFRHFLLSYCGPGKAGARKTHDLPRALRAPCTRALTRSAFLSRHKCNSNTGRAGQIPAFDFELLELLRPWPDRPDPELTDGFWSRAVYKCVR